MVDALQEIRRILTPGGIMLDLRPISEQNLVEIVPPCGAAVPFGKIDAYGALEEDRAADRAIEHALAQRWFIRESDVKFDVESYWDTAAELDAFARCSRRLREAKLSADEIEERRRELGSPEAPARVRFHRTMMLDRYRACS
jgi:hypothetical protein